MIKLHEIFVSSIQKVISLRFELFLEFYWCPLTPMLLMQIFWDIPNFHPILNYWKCLELRRIFQLL